MNRENVVKLTQSPAWKALQAHQAEIARTDMRDLFAQVQDG